MLAVGKGGWLGGWVGLGDCINNKELCEQFVRCDADDIACKV